MKKVLIEVEVPNGFEEVDYSAIRFLVEGYGGNKIRFITQPADSGQDIDCPTCKGSEIRGEQRGVRCLDCNGTGVKDSGQELDADKLSLNGECGVSRKRNKEPEPFGYVYEFKYGSSEPEFSFDKAHQDDLRVNNKGAWLETAVYASPPAREGWRPKDEIGWLIEMTSVKGIPASWIDPDLKMTKDANKAIRFARKCDGEAFLDLVFAYRSLYHERLLGRSNYTVTEHMFMAAPSTAPEARDE